MTSTCSANASPPFEIFSHTGTAKASSLIISGSRLDQEMTFLLYCSYSPQYLSTFSTVTDKGFDI